MGPQRSLRQDLPKQCLLRIQFRAGSVAVSETPKALQQREQHGQSRQKVSPQKHIQEPQCKSEDLISSQLPRELNSATPSIRWWECETIEKRKQSGSFRRSSTQAAARSTLRIRRSTTSGTLMGNGRSPWSATSLQQGKNIGFPKSGSCPC